MDDPEKIEHYRTLAAPGEAKLKERGSLFLAFSLPIANSEEADSQLRAWRKEYHDATHVGWARRLAPPPDGEERWDDDGEPHGSTGPPILNAIRGAELWGVLVGVVRYFGGTKLGVGGLIRAYGGAAAAALEAAPVKRVLITRRLEVSVSHERASAVYAMAEKHSARLDTPHFTENGLILPMTISRSRLEPLIRDILEVTAGSADCRILP